MNRGTIILLLMVLASSRLNRWLYYHLLNGGLGIVGWHAYLRAEVLRLQLGDWDRGSLASRIRWIAWANVCSPIGPKESVKLPIGVFVIGD